MFEEPCGSEIGGKLGSVVGVSCLFSESGCFSLQQDNGVGFSQDNKCEDSHNTNLVMISEWCPLLGSYSFENSLQLK